MFFFSGPEMFGIPIEKRITYRQEIFDILCKSNSKFTISDAFIVLDYNEIEKINWTESNIKTGDYFKLIDGKVTVGSRKNQKEVIENYYSIEYFWNTINYILPTAFKNKLIFLNMVFSNGIIDNENANEIMKSYKPHSLAEDEQKPNFV